MGRGERYHQMPNDGFVEILRSHVDSLGDQEPPIDMFLPHAAFSFLDSGDPVSLQPAGFALLPGFASVFQCRDLSFRRGRKPQQRQVWSTGTTRPPTTF